MSAAFDGLIKVSTFDDRLTQCEHSYNLQLDGETVDSVTKWMAMDADDFCVIAGDRNGRIVAFDFCP